VALKLTSSSEFSRQANGTRSGWAICKRRSSSACATADWSGMSTKGGRSSGGIPGGASGDLPPDAGELLEPLRNARPLTGLNVLADIRRPWEGGCSCAQALGLDASACVVLAAIGQTMAALAAAAAGVSEGSSCNRWASRSLHTSGSNA
jgi:hypothetical protein